MQNSAAASASALVFKESSVESLGHLIVTDHPIRFGFQIDIVSESCPRRWSLPWWPAIRGMVVRRSLMTSQCATNAKTARGFAQRSGASWLVGPFSGTGGLNKRGASAAPAGKLSCTVAIRSRNSKWVPSNGFTSPFTARRPRRWRP